MKEKIRHALLFAFIASIITLGAPSVQASMIYISVDPVHIEVPAPGELFNVTVNVIDVINLGAISFKLWYNTTLLNATYTYLTPMSTAYLSDYGPLDRETWEYTPTSPINNTLGRIYWFAVVRALTNPFNGTAPVLTITFKAKEIGSCPLHLNETELWYIYPAYPFPTREYVLDTEYSLIDGSVTVIPEFPPATLIPLLLITTLTVTFLRKMVWSRKRKNLALK